MKGVPPASGDRPEGHRKGPVRAGHPAQSGEARRVPGRDGDRGAALLKEVHDGLYERALENRRKRTYACRSLEDIVRVLEEKGDGFIEAMWCGDEACEDAVKEKPALAPAASPWSSSICPTRVSVAGKPAKHMVLWGKAY